MCGPATALGLQAAGGAYQTVGAYYSASGQRAALKGEADIADVNARLAELGAESALTRGQREEQKSRLQTAQLKSTQRASMAANGIDLGSDTPVNVLTTTDVMGEVDANTIAANAARNAWGYRTQRVTYQNEALMKRTTAKAINPFMSAAGQFLTTASSVADKYYTYKKAGLIKDNSNEYGPNNSWWARNVSQF